MFDLDHAEIINIDRWSQWFCKFDFHSQIKFLINELIHRPDMYKTLYNPLLSPSCKHLIYILMPLIKGWSILSEMSYLDDFNLRQ